MTLPTKPDVQRLRELASKATPGPYVVDGLDVIAERPPLGWFRQCVATANRHWDERYGNAAFIAAASPDVVLALLDENERLRSLANRALNVASGLLDLTAPGLDTFRDLGITDIAEIREELSK